MDNQSSDGQKKLTLEEELKETRKGGLDFQTYSVHWPSLVEVCKRYEERLAAVTAQLDGAAADLNRLVPFVENCLIFAGKQVDGNQLALRARELLAADPSQQEG